MSRTSVEKFYSGQTIFLTGGTGFVGKLIIEKLLRVCYDIDKLYILVREKRGSTVDRRFEEIFNHACFDRLKNERPNFKEKLQLIQGDCQAVNLGLSETDEQKLINEVTCVFHGAATVKFDEKLRKATNINVRGVKYMLKLAKQMPKLKAFVHISTAYSNCVQENIDEKFYESPIEVNDFLNGIEAIDDKTLDTLTPHLLGKWPNTYVFTKAIAEQVIREEAVGLPVAIVRPSIIVSTIEEPMPGWIDNFYNIVGLSLGGYLGLIRMSYIQNSVFLHVVPCDFVVNSLLCVAWNIEDEKICMREHYMDKESRITIYNITTPKNSFIRLDDYFNMMTDFAHKYPSIKSIYAFCHVSTENFTWFRICNFLLHTFPAYIIDLMLLIFQKKPLAVRGYHKLNKLLDLLRYFQTTHFHFENANVRRLLEKLTDEERKLFNFDMNYFDWACFFERSFMGGRRYLLKESIDKLPQARTRMSRLILLHYLVKTIFFYLAFRLLCIIFNWAFSLI